ncbi:MAG: thiamine-phosphate kinase [Rikenellaceae bacterium]
MERTELSTLKKARFVERLTNGFHSSIIAGIGDDAAVIDRGENLELLSQTLFMEGIDFDLSYTPLEHLGLKLVTAGVSNVAAMNGTAKYITVGVALSARFSVEEAEALYSGVQRGCEIYGVELIGGDTASSMTGMTLSVSVIGSVAKDRLCLRSGASQDELICYTGTLGGAYMGLKLLEREKRAGANAQSAREIFENHKFILGRQLHPYARVDIIEILEESDVVPTSMIDITSGLASAVLSICTASDVGARIQLSRLPVSSEVQKMANELGADPIVAMLNGGDDYELLFTLPVALHEKVNGLSDIHVVGFTTSKELGAAIVTPDGEAIGISSPDFNPEQ